MLRHECGNVARDQFRHTARQRDADRPLDSLVSAEHAASEPLKRAVDAFGHREHVAARLRQHEVAPAPLEQRRAEGLFEIGDAARHGRAVDAETLRRLRQ